MSNKLIKNIDFGKVIDLKEHISYGEGRVSSVSLAQKSQVSVTLFSFDKGEGLSTHQAPGDAMVTVLEGSVSITIQDTKLVLKAGETTVMPANVPHGLVAIEKFKMLLIIIKPDKEEIELEKHTGCGCS